MPCQGIPEALSPFHCLCLGLFFFFNPLCSLLCFTSLCSRWLSLRWLSKGTGGSELPTEH